MIFISTKYYSIIVALLIISSCTNTREVTCSDISKQFDTSLHKFYSVEIGSTKLSNRVKEWHLVIDNLCEEMYNSNKVMIVLQTSKSDFDRQGLLYLMDSDSICYFQQKGNKILIDKLGTKLSEIKKFVLYTKGDFRTLQNSIAKTNNIIVNDAPNLDFFLYDKYNMDLSWFYSFEYNSKIFELETLDTLK